MAADRKRLDEYPLEAGVDPLAADFDRSLGELALSGTRIQVERAADALAELARAETEASETEARPPLPAHGWTLVLLGRAAGRLGDINRAAECFRMVTSLAGEGMDPRHPVILSAHYDEAVRCADIGNTRQAASLLAPVLDRAPLDHGRPALDEAHPVLAGARALAERLGVSVPYATTRPDEASLDIDA